MRKRDEDFPLKIGFQIGLRKIAERMSDALMAERALEEGQWEYSATFSEMHKLAGLAHSYKHRFAVVGMLRRRKKWELEVEKMHDPNRIYQESKANDVLASLEKFRLQLVKRFKKKPV